MFSAINKLLDKKQETSLPEAKSDKGLAEKIRLKFRPGIHIENVIGDIDVRDVLRCQMFPRRSYPKCLAEKEH